ncbi:hypothetical protein C8J57DRAFT_1004921, partial [Mycena rebaudengoi]
PATRDDILRIANSVWDDGLFITFGALLPRIAPDSLIYRSDRCLETIRHAKATPVLFVWCKAPRLLVNPIPGAAYAIAFFIPSVTPFQIVGLTYMVLRFMDKYIRDADYTRFKLVSISYKLGVHGSVGVLVCDHDLRTMYRKIHSRARTSSSSFRRS